MLLVNYKEELIFFGIDIWQKIIIICFTYQQKKKHAQESGHFREMCLL